MSAPLASVVVPSYNYGRFLRECLDSALRQEGGIDLELVVVDDGSSDDSAEIIRSYRDPRVRAFFHETNKGHVDTINEGLSHARGRYVARVDSDDRLRPGFLRETIARLEKNPGAVAAHANAAWIDAEGRTLEEFPPHPYGRREREGNEFEALLKKNFLPAPTLLARREAWQKALPIPKGLGFSDWYLNLRLAAQGPFCYVPLALADYRIHQGGLHHRMTKDRSEERAIEAILERVFAETGVPAALRREALASQALQLADKYFWFGMNEDARRCYLRAIKLRPANALKAGPMRRLLASALGRRHYDAMKALLGRGVRKEAA